MVYQAKNWTVVSGLVRPGHWEVSLVFSEPTTMILLGTQDRTYVIQV